MHPICDSPRRPSIRNAYQTRHHRLTFFPSLKAKDRFASFILQANRSFFSLSLGEEEFSLFKTWRGGAAVARLGATFGGIRGIGEGVLRRRAGVLCSSVPVLCRFCAATNGLITPFIGQLQRKHSIFIKRYFKIVYRKRVRKVLCFRCFRCRGLLKIPPPLVNLLALIV